MLEVYIYVAGRLVERETYFGSVNRLQFRASELVEVHELTMREPEYADWRMAMRLNGHWIFDLA